MKDILYFRTWPIENKSALTKLSASGSPSMRMREILVLPWQKCPFLLLSPPSIAPLTDFKNSFHLIPCRHAHVFYSSLSLMKKTVFALAQSANIYIWISNVWGTTTWLIVHIFFCFSGIYVICCLGNFSTQMFFFSKLCSFFRSAERYNNLIVAYA